MLYKIIKKKGIIIFIIIIATTITIVNSIAHSNSVTGY